MKIARLADVKARLVLSRSLQFQSLLEKSRESIRRGKGLSASDFWSAAKKRPGKRAKQVSPVPYPRPLSKLFHDTAARVYRLAS